MVETRPVRIAYKYCASLRCVLVLPGIESKVKMFATGSPEAIPMVMVGTTCVPFDCCQRLIWSNVPPKVTVCALAASVKLAANCFTGEFRRELVAVVYGLEK